MRKFTRRYGRGIIDALKPLNARARLLGAHAPAWVRRQWLNRDRLLRQGGRWIGRHKLAVSAALMAIVAWLIGRIDWPEKVLSWSFWTQRPEDVRILLLVSVGAVAAALGLVLAAIRTYAANLQARVAEQGHITDRFTKAIEQLGNDKLEVRLGAIYALERIAWDSQRDHWPIMETLTAYARENAPWPPKQGTEALEKLLAAHIPVGGDPSDKPVTEEDPVWVKLRTDIQAILTILRRRNLDHVEGGQLNLTNTYLRKADLRGAHLEGAYLERANLGHAHLEGAKLGCAHLEGAYLEGAKLGGAYLREADLGHAYLERAKLGRAHLEGAFLEGAYLREAYLGQAHLEGAKLEGAFLRGANLEHTQGLTQEQLAGTYCDEKTKLPKGITIPLADAAGQ